jgi:transcriptional regulator with XRE-family HTH domain
MSRAALPRTDLAQPLGRAIKARLAETEPKVTQAALAAAVHVSTATIERWLAGKAAMTVDNLAAIARLFGCPPSTLVREAELLRQGGDELAARRDQKRAGQVPPAAKVAKRIRKKPGRPQVESGDA